MTEKEIETPAVEENISEGETPEVTNAEKSFSQKELDSLIQTRIAREKATAKKQLADAVAEKEAELAEYKTRVDNFEKIFSPLVEDMMKNQAPAVQKLLKKLDLIEQYSFLSDEGNQVARKSLPSTPKPEGEEQSKQKKMGVII